MRSLDLAKASLRIIVERRVKEYGGQPDGWFSDWFLPMLERLEVEAVACEEIIGFLSNSLPLWVRFENTEDSKAV